MTSLKQIAEHSGCSLSTVSRALNDSPLISEPVKRKIRTIAQSLGYSPNMQAKVLAGRRAKVIGFMASELRYVHDSAILRGVEDGAAQAGYSVLACFYYDDVARVESYRSLLSQNLFDGVIIGFSGWQWRKESFGTKPVVYTDQWPEEASVRAVVTSDHHRGADTILGFYVSAGVKRVVYCGNGRSNSVEHMRLTLVKRACAHAGISFEQAPPELAVMEALAAGEGQTGTSGLVLEPPAAWVQGRHSTRLRSFCRRAVVACYDTADEQTRSLFSGGIVLQQDHGAMGRMAFELVHNLIEGKRPARFVYSPVTSTTFWTNHQS